MKLKINIDKEIKTSEDVLSAIIEFHNEVTGVLIDNKENIAGMSPQKYVSTMMYISLHLCSIFAGDDNKLKFKNLVSGIVDSYLQTKDVYKKIDNAASSSKLYN